MNKLKIIDSIPIKNYIKNNSHEIKCVVFITFLTGILSYYLFAIDGYGHPDSLCEGLYYYTGADWATMCGRWAVRYLNFLSGHNVVIPGLILFLYLVCVSIAVLLLSYFLNIKKVSSLIMVSAMMTASPVIVCQLTFSYLAVAYAVSFLATVLYCVLVRQKSALLNIVGVIFLVLSMGLYQTYIGVAFALIIFITLLDILDGRSIEEIIRGLIKYVVTGIIAVIIDIAEFKAELYFRNLSEASRVSQFDLRLIITSFKESLKNSYIVFAQYFADGILKRKYFYVIFTITAVSALIILLMRIYKQKQFWRIAATIVLILSIPAGMNIVSILIPYNGISSIMKYQYVLVIPLAFALFERISIKEAWKQMMNLAIYVSLIAIIFTYIISANATFLGLRISYRTMEKQTELILTVVNDLNEFELNKTKIVFAGSPSDDYIRSRLPLYRYSLVDSPVFYNNMQGMVTQRYNYLLNYFGINAGNFSHNAYKAIVTGNEFLEMPVWPSKGSIKMIDGMAVVKLSDTPYIP